MSEHQELARPRDRARSVPARRAPGGAATPWWLREVRVAVLVVTDLAALFLAGALGYVSWALPVHGTEGQPPILFLRLASLLPLFVLVFAQAGLYPAIGLGPVETLRRLSLSTLLSFLFLAAINYAFKSPYLYSRASLALSLGFALVLLPAGRFLLRRAARRWRWWQEPVVLVGDEASVRGALRALASPSQADYRPVGWLGPAAGDAECPIPRLGALSDLPSAVPPAVRIAVIPDTPRLPDLDLLNLHFRRVVLLRVYGHLPVEGAQVRNMGGLVGIEYVNSLLRPHNRAVKRSLDLILGLLAFLLALPFIAAAAVAVKLASRGPAFFVQRRAGLDGRPVAVPKIRTMHVDAEARLEEHLASDPVLRAEWVEHMKLRQDPRLIPVVGPLLRRFSLDELPQLWSVVKGDMSLVGPRPFPDYHLEMFSASFRELRQRVRPGITGLWQVTLRSEGGIDEQEAADSYYIRNWSLWLDVYLLACTLGAVLRGKGAY